MFKIEIKLNGVLTNYSEFTTEDLCIAWMRQNNFAVDEVKVYRSEALEQGLSLVGKTPLFEPAPLGGEEKVYYMFPAPQTYTITNIDQEIQKKNEATESKEAIALTTSIKEQIRTLNKRKLRDGVWTAETFNAFISSTLIAQAERALGQASLGGYLSLIPQATAFYTEEEITVIADQVNQHVQKWAAKGVV
jgi:hypothetical protein